jgi:hypothetical protein
MRPPQAEAPDVRRGEQWGIEYNGNTARTCNMPWYIYSAKTLNTVASAAALDYANNSYYCFEETAGIVKLTNLKNITFIQLNTGNYLFLAILTLGFLS